MFQTKYIYACESEKQLGLIKIEKTRGVTQRVRDYHWPRDSKPDNVLCLVPTLYPNRDEQHAHEYFKDKRVTGKYFNVSYQEVMNYFQEQLIVSYNRDVRDILKRWNENDSEAEPDPKKDQVLSSDAEPVTPT